MSSHQQQNLKNPNKVENTIKLMSEYSENLIDEISQVPLTGVVNDTSLTFIDLPVSATETARESDSTDESDDDSDSD